MRSFWANSANSHTGQIHPALTGFADECCGTLARLLVYVGTLALLAIFGLQLWDRLPADETSEPAAGPGWSTAGRAHPAFAVSQLDLPEKTETYEILRHPQGGRKDVLHRAAQGEKPVAELEIDRPGDEISPSRRARTAIGDRMDPNGGRQLERAAISWILSRLMLLTAGNDRKLAELFARAELRRGSCAAQGTSGASVDWVTSAENPHLRGPL